MKVETELYTSLKSIISKMLLSLEIEKLVNSLGQVDVWYAARIF